MNAKRPKVLSLIDTHYVGGAGKVLIQFAGQAGERVDYTLGAFRHRNPPSTEFIDSARAKGLKLALFGQFFNLDPRPLWTVARHLRRGRYDIIETHGYKGHLIAWLLRRFLPVKWLGMTHGWTDENRKMRFYNQLERALLKSADRVVCVSPQLAETMRQVRKGRGGVLLVLNAVDEAALKGEGRAEAIRREALGEELVKNAILLGSFGRLSPEKGHRFLIRAVERLSARHDLSLLLVGDGQEREHLQRLAASLGIEDRVIFAGQRDNMRDYYEAIDLFVLPSLSEGLPFVVLEAMAMEKPVLATRVGALPQVIDEGVNGWLVPAGDAGLLANAIGSVIRDSRSLKETGKRARKTLYPRFSAERQAAEMISIYQEVIRD